MGAQERTKQLQNHLSYNKSTGLLLQDQVVVITGAGQGIGKATALICAQHGARVVVADIDESRAAETVAEVEGLGSEALCIVGDVLDAGFPTKLIQDTLDRFGRINCVVNNAGFCMDRAIHKMKDNEFDTIIKVHNTVPFRITRALAPHWMDPANKDMPKTIINVSSTSGLHGSMGQINYSTAKMGIVGMTKTIAAEWGRYNVRCNAVAYGWIDTRITRPPTSSNTFVVNGEKVTPGIPESAKVWRDLSTIPLGRVGTTEDAAGVMLFLASSLSAYVTGTVIECTGGRFM